MAKCTGSVSLPQTLPKSAEHTNCLLQVTESDTDGITKYQKPESVSCNPARPTSREVSESLYPAAGCGLGFQEGACTCTCTHKYTHSRRGCGAQDIQNWKEPKTQNAEEPFTGHALWLLASNFAFCAHPHLSSSWWTAEWPVHGHRVHDRAPRVSPEPRVLTWAAPSGLHGGPVTLTLTRPTTRARKKMLLPILRSPKRFFFHKKRTIWGQLVRDGASLHTLRLCPCTLRFPKPPDRRKIPARPAETRGLGSRVGAEDPGQSVCFLP